ncbi:sporulation protein YunB [Anaerobacillus isosaccharinicus]|uniref:Sporulation protein YunB n=1 Tax=Anaerobacillus isosaccharinicus TaxID=1532552 RepID=A0A1S2MDH3_9BACI|nr:sporulation protein YunB [Anaerobacillus isosaccharinicus]MBA5588570.1 sporulation protein YunB [Anaerobacillus isosaccharinicus]QOY38015.1 sporulation protein YunB [Anaerobacillus isosaccharinicus]
MFKRRRYRPKRGPLPFRYVFLISFLIFIVLTAQGLVLVEAGIRPTLIEIAKTETQRIATIAINEAVRKKTLENNDMDKLIDIKQDNNGRIISAHFNSIIVSRVLQETTLNVQRFLNDVSKGNIKDLAIPDGIEVDQDTYQQHGIIHMIPLGQATNNALLGHLGPKVPVRLTAIGDVKSQIHEEILSIGINNAWISLSIEITVDVRVVIPFATDTKEVTTLIPVGMIYIQGDVPQFFHAGGSDGGMPMPAIINQQDLEDAVNNN